MLEVVEEIEISSLEMVYECTTCNLLFVDLELHLQNCHADGVIDDVEPQEEPKEKTNAKKGKRENVTKKGFLRHECRYCAKPCQTPFKKIMHERTHTGEKPYVCDVSDV
jgi:hypothetical protein